MEKNVGKNRIKNTVITFLSASSIIVCFPFLFCKGGNGNNPGYLPGNKVTYKIDNIKFRMIFVPGGKAFPSMPDDSITKTVKNAYWIGETEVTFELWKKVYDWALINGYRFSNSGIIGDNGKRTNKHPVTMVSWRDAMVWCNALTEWYNAKNKTHDSCVYYIDERYTIPIRNSGNAVYRASINPKDGSFDKPYIMAKKSRNLDMSNCSATGFRLLTNDEWELAARYRGADKTNSVQSTIGGIDFGNPADGVYWTKADCASGVIEDAIDFNSYNMVAWFGNSTVYGMGNTVSTRPVAEKTANGLGIYDMSGNVLEWCFDCDLFSVRHDRIERGGCWASDANQIKVGFCFSYYPYGVSNDLGFRFAKNL